MMINGNRASTEYTFKKSLFPVALMGILELFYRGGVRGRKKQQTAAVAEKVGPHRRLELPLQAMVDNVRR